VTGVARGPESIRVVLVSAPHGRTIDHWHYSYKLSFLDALAERARQWLARSRTSSWPVT
jgi:hypothetical protein